MLALRISSSSNGEEFLLHHLLRLLDASTTIRANTKDSDVSNIVCVLQCSILRLLCVWLYHCPRAVDEILVKPSNLFLYGLVRDHVDVTAQWCSMLLGICMMCVSSQCDVKSEHVLDAIIKNIGLRTYTDTMAMVTNSKRWKTAKRQSKIRYEDPCDNPSALFASREEIHKGLPPTVDGSCVSYLKELSDLIPRRMIELYGKIDENDENYDDASSLRRNISVLKSLLVLQDRRREGDKNDVDLNKEPEIVKLYDAYATAMREVDRIRTESEKETKEREEEVNKFEKELKTLREENKKLCEEMEKHREHQVQKQSQSQEQNSNNIGGFLAMGSAIERFAEIENLKIEVTSLTEKLEIRNNECMSLDRDLKLERSKVSEQSKLLSQVQTLKDEHHDLLELLAHVEAERVATQMELERVAGVHAVKRAKLKAEDSLERASRTDGEGKQEEEKEEEDKKKELSSSIPLSPTTPPTPPVMRKKEEVRKDMPLTKRTTESLAFEV